VTTADVQTDRAGDNTDHHHRAESRTRRPTLLPTTRARVNAIDRVGRHGHTKTTRTQDVAEPAFELVVLCGHRISTRRPTR
jgi:hypothetical protein